MGLVLFFCSIFFAIFMTFLNSMNEIKMSIQKNNTSKRALKSWQEERYPAGWEFEYKTGVEKYRYWYPRAQACIEEYGLHEGEKKVIDEIVQECNQRYPMLNGNVQKWIQNDTSCKYFILNYIRFSTIAEVLKAHRGTVGMMRKNPIHLLEMKQGRSNPEFWGTSFMYDEHPSYETWAKYNRNPRDGVYYRYEFEQDWYDAVCAEKRKQDEESMLHYRAVEGRIQNEIW